MEYEKSGFTPGPWHADHADLEGGRVSIVDIPGGSTLGLYAGDNGRANANLIAAAPDLYDSLAALVADQLEYERVNNLAPTPGKPDCWQSVTAAKAALARARGDSSAPSPVNQEPVDGTGRRA